MISSIITQFFAKDRGNSQGAISLVLLSVLFVSLIFASGCSADTAGQVSSAESEETSSEDDDAQEEAASSSQVETVSSQESVSKQSFYFDTICTITVYAIDPDVYVSWNPEGSEDTFDEAASSIITDVFYLCSEYEQLLSKTVEGSDIWNINNAGGEAVSCDARTIALLEMGLYYSELSDGRFDITIGAAQDLWDFHSEEEEQELPDAELLREAMEHVDYTAILVSAEEGTVQLSDEKAQIDLGGIAKGYIADAICERLSQAGVLGAIISLGGNIACVGSKPSVFGFLSGDDWKEDASDFTIGIESPYSDQTAIVGYSKVSDGTMVTSGVYERYITVDDVQYHHILDTKTGWPVDTDVLGVTILGGEGTSADCDALATICLILGAEDGLALMEEQDGLEAAFILEDGSIKTTSGMDFTAIE